MENPTFKQQQTPYSSSSPAELNPSIMKCVLGLKTSSRRKINPKNLVNVYAKIMAQKTRFVRLFLKGLGIPSSQIKNISFVGKNICELLVHKNFKDQLIKILQDCRIDILDNFDPKKCAKEGTIEKKDIERTELAYYKRINNIINRRNCPDCVREFYIEVLNNTNFEVINVPSMY